MMAPQLVTAAPVTPAPTRQRSGGAGAPPAGNGQSARRLVSDPQHLWSTDARSKQLVPQHLAHVEAGVEEAAKDLKFCLKEAEDLAWLRDHQGRFQMRVPLCSLHHKTKVVNSVQMKDKLPSEIAEHFLTKLHQVVGSSTRSCSGAGAGNCQKKFNLPR